MSGEKTMNTFESELAIEQRQDNGPSADFICAISELLDTDPKDLLVELGYYNSDEAPSGSHQADPTR